jgi:hypothetical protein
MERVSEAVTLSRESAVTSKFIRVAWVPYCIVLVQVLVYHFIHDQIRDPITRGSPIKS